MLAPTMSAGTGIMMCAQPGVPVITPYASGSTRFQTPVALMELVLVLEVLLDLRRIEARVGARDRQILPTPVDCGALYLVAVVTVHTAHVAAVGLGSPGLAAASRRTIEHVVFK